MAVFSRCCVMREAITGLGPAFACSTKAYYSPSVQWGTRRIGVAFLMSGDSHKTR